MLDSALIKAVTTLPLAAVLLDADGRVLSATPALERLMRASPGEFAGAGLADLFPAETGVLQRMAAVRDGRSVVRLEGQRRTGVPFTAEARVSLCGPGLLLCVLTEVDHARLAAEPPSYLDAAFDRAPIGMALFNTDGEYVRVNRVLCELLGRRSEQLLGRRDQELTHPDDRPADVLAAWRILNGEMDVWQTEKRFLAADGQVIWVIANLAFIRDSQGHPLCWLGQFQDITDRKGREEELAHLAEHDELTGLVNRRGLLRELTERLQGAECSDEFGALLLLDLDGFKAVNDHSGHEAGDQLLLRVGGALRSGVREGDTVGRLGGDEFAVIVRNAAPQGAEATAISLVAAIEQASDGAVTASCGVALYGPGRATLAGPLLSEADAAMYRAKNRRRLRDASATARSIAGNGRLQPA